MRAFIDDGILGFDAAITPRDRHVISVSVWKDGMMLGMVDLKCLDVKGLTWH